MYSELFEIFGWEAMDVAAKNLFLKAEEKIDKKNKKRIKEKTQQQWQIIYLL